MGKVTEFKEIRVISMGHYSIPYKLKHPNIIITGFWDNRQDSKNF